jgi:Zn-dependent alcohol dehydrogenase
VVQGARAAGAAQIIASDPLDSRRRAAASMGATTVLDPAVDDVLAATADLTGVGADYAFECAGVAALAGVGVEATRAGGTTVLVGAPPLEGKLELDPLVLFGISEKKLMGCFLGSCNSLRDIPRLVALWRAGQLDLEALVTARRPLDEINDAFADLAAGVGIRTVVDLV